MKKTIQITMSLMLFSLLFSCKKSDPKIYYNTAFLGKNKVTIDDTVSLKANVGKDKFDFIRLGIGEHSVKINNGNPMKFNAQDDGILNIAQQEFVIFSIKFSLEEEDSHVFSTPTPIIVEDFVVVNDDSAHHKKNPLQATDSFYKAHAIDDKAYNPHEKKIRDLTKVPKTVLFIEKTWDYDIYEPIPETIQVQNKKKNVKTAAFKKGILDAKGFLVYAEESGEYKLIHN
jgi:hypothetical protein